MRRVLEDGSDFESLVNVLFTSQAWTDPSVDQEVERLTTLFSTLGVPDTLETRKAFVFGISHGLGIAGLESDYEALISYVSAIRWATSFVDLSALEAVTYDPED